MRKSEHLYLISHRVSPILILMSKELREICRMIHVMSPNSNINWSRGVEDGEAKIKNKNVRRKFEILKYIEEHPGVKKKDVAENSQFQPKTFCCD